VDTENSIFNTAWHITVYISTNIIGTGMTSQLPADMAQMLEYKVCSWCVLKLSTVKIVCNVFHSYSVSSSHEMMFTFNEHNVTYNLHNVYFVMTQIMRHATM